MPVCRTNNGATGACSQRHHRVRIQHQSASPETSREERSRLVQKVHTSRGKTHYLATGSCKSLWREHAFVHTKRYHVKKHAAAAGTQVQGGYPCRVTKSARSCVDEGARNLRNSCCLFFCPLVLGHLALTSASSSSSLIFC